jgi:hypothetical protein
MEYHNKRWYGWYKLQNWVEKMWSLNKKNENIVIKKQKKNIVIKIALLYKSLKSVKW